MPRLNLSSAQRDYAIYALKQMQRRDAQAIQFNLDVAKATDSVRDLSFGRLAFSMPEDHRRILALIFPAIDSEDGKERSKAWMKLMKHELTLPYRINAKETGGHKHARQALHRRNNEQRIST